MIVVTLLAVPCGYVAWQAKIVRERRAELNRAVDMRLTGINESDEEIIPWIRRMLGDQCVVWIGEPIGTDAAEVNRLQSLFPEAKIEVAMPGEYPTSADP
jgi:hypothetical protein